MTPYGCHSKPRQDGYWAKDKTCLSADYSEIIQLAKWIPDTMTRECQYRKSTPDPRCEGCTCP